MTNTEYQWYVNLHLSVLVLCGAGSVTIQGNQEPKN